MRNFVLNHPTKIIFGKNTIPSIGAETAALGKKVLLVTGQKAVKNTGIYDQVCTSLSSNGCEIVHFSGISPNPDLAMVHNGIELARQMQCDSICAVGGGSVIDVGKAIRCGVPARHDVWKFFLGKKKMLTALPLTCAVTLAGSGSETNSGMVLVNKETMQKFGYGNKLLYPTVSVLDPETTFSVPADLTAYGVVDASAHLIEFFCNNNEPNSHLQHAFIIELLRGILHSCKIALQEPSNYQHRAQLLWGSSLALHGILTSGLGRIGFPLHLIEHSFSPLTNSTHGAGLAAIIPAWMRYAATIRPEPIARLGYHLFSISQPSQRESALETSEKFGQLFSELNCPSSLTELGIELSDIDWIAENSRKLATIWKLREYSPETIKNILMECL